MKLAELLEGVAGATVRGDPATEIRGLAYHTRDVADGTLFFCVPGLTFDGHAFAARAAAAGAAALVCERDTGVALPQVLVPSVRRAMALVAARWYEHPSRELTVVGVTGTNGKTTTAHLVAGIFAAAGRPAALLGTVVNRIGGRDDPVRLTTAEALDLQRMFREMVAAGDRACALEISSHALAQDRAAGIDFDAVVFSNLTRDHLDFHSDLDDYYAAKRKLFLPEEARNGAASGGRQRRRRVRPQARARVPARVRRRPLDLRRRRGAARRGRPGRAGGRRRRPRPRAARRQLPPSCSPSLGWASRSA